MKTLYSLETWVIFLIIFIPMIFQNTLDGGILSITTFLIGAVWFYQLTLNLNKNYPVGMQLIFVYLDFISFLRLPTLLILLPLWRVIQLILTIFPRSVEKQIPISDFPIVAAVLLPIDNSR